MSKLDETWHAFTEARAKLSVASARVRDVTANLASQTKALAEARHEEIRAARNLRAAMAKVPGLLYAEVSGACGGITGGETPEEDESDGATTETPG